MTTEVFRKKTGRYLCGMSLPAERNQIQYWLSCTQHAKPQVSPEQRQIVENEIVSQVHAYALSSSLKPQKEKWWQQITAVF
jgi:hypothetical protein